MRASRIYSPVMKFLHWTIVVLVAVQFLAAWTMPEIRGNSSVGFLLSIHMSFGLLILPIAFFLLIARFIFPVEKPETRDSFWQYAASVAMHYVLYILLILLPFSGLAFATARGITVSFLGIMPIPQILSASASFTRTFGELHSSLATIIGLLVLAHAGAAFYHHYMQKDSVLSRMLPSWFKLPKLPIQTP